MSEIADLLGVSVGTVSNRLQAAGVETRSLHDYPPTEAQIAARKRLAAAGRATQRPGCNCRREKGKPGAKHMDKTGYISVYLPEHPRANRAGCVQEHRLVMEELLGRYLTDTDVVHHINHKRADNRPENLVVMDKIEHCRLHGLEIGEKRRKDIPPSRKRGEKALGGGNYEAYPV